MNNLLELLYKNCILDTVLKAINHFDQETDFETPLHLRDSSAITKGQNVWVMDQEPASHRISSIKYRPNLPNQVPIVAFEDSSVAMEIAASVEKEPILLHFRYNVPVPYLFFISIILKTSS